MARPTLCLAALMVLPCLFASVAHACGSNSKNTNRQTTDPHYEDGTVSVRKTTQSVRLRRSLVETVDDLGTLPTETLSIEVFNLLDTDEDGVLSVVDWSIEGGSVKDFWALLGDYDGDGDEKISYPEFASIIVSLSDNEA